VTSDKILFAKTSKFTSGFVS